MQEQVAAGIMEPVPPHRTGEVVNYIPHQAVIREQAETTKMRIVYDCSSRTDTQTPSLNDCLETGPPLQPLLFDILLRNRMRKHCVTGDIQKAFLQIRVYEQDRDAQRVLWYDNLTDRNIAEYRSINESINRLMYPIAGINLNYRKGQRQQTYLALVFNSNKVIKTSCAA